MVLLQKGLYSLITSLGVHAPESIKMTLLILVKPPSEGTILALRPSGSDDSYSVENAKSSAKNQIHQGIILYLKLLQKGTLRLPQGWAFLEDNRPG